MWRPQQCAVESDMLAYIWLQVTVASVNLLCALTVTHCCRSADFQKDALAVSKSFLRQVYFTTIANDHDYDIERVNEMIQTVPNNNLPLYNIYEYEVFLLLTSIKKTSPWT